MELQGSKNIRAGNGTVGVLTHLPSVFGNRMMLIKQYLKKKLYFHSSATAALSGDKNLSSVSTLN